MIFEDYHVVRISVDFPLRKSRLLHPISAVFNIYARVWTPRRGTRLIACPGPKLQGTLPFTPFNTV
jgi:hypothetical protein